MNLPADINLIQRLDSLIRLKATGCPDELGERIGISRRQVYRIIDEMKVMGFPVAYCRSRKTFYYEQEVKFTFEICVMEEKEVRKTIGGKNYWKNFKDFFSVPDFGTKGEFLCCNNVIEGGC